MAGQTGDYQSDSLGKDGPGQTTNFSRHIRQRQHYQSMRNKECSPPEVSSTTTMYPAQPKIMDGYYSTFEDRFYALRAPSGEQSAKRNQSKAADGLKGSISQSLPMGVNASYVIVVDAQGL
ncbi:hypothetical protein ElyMa_000543700 [Elysia marginata]|uniref:Uncharacterized protein n=1 Tax=Elysia marginata TaxID=1093978 RepID=A0AAV4G0D2_9GAST|nr:hypothetical protein ElyMa_000543700 [Elysia marginata]